MNSPNGWRPEPETYGKKNPFLIDRLPSLIYSFYFLGVPGTLNEFVAPEAAFRNDCFITHDWGTDELGRRNHERVAAINESLSLRGLRTWIDTNAMPGNIMDQLTLGMNSSRCVVVCITRNYVDKVESNSFNVCQLEFNNAVRKKQGSIVAIVMEPRMRDITRMNGFVGMSLC